MTFSTLELTLILLSASVLGVVLFRMLHLPPMLGYLAVGIVIGPNAMGWVPNNDGTQTLAEFGVVFLMFSIGLEFSLPKLMAMRRIVFGLGLAQVLLTVGVTMLFGAVMAHWLPQVINVSAPAAFALGGALAMSSTAIVSKMLTERLELESEHGRRIMSVLLFQDLALVPLLIIVPALTHPGGDLVATLAWATLKAALVLIVLLFLGQKLLRRWLRIVVQRRSQELFTLNLLLITLGAAWITERAGLSMALGAFVAGMLISETKYRHQVEEDIKPFRDVLLGLFFISIGMLLNVPLVLQNWWLVLLLLAGPVLLKFGLITVLAKAFGASTGVALRTGLGLAQAGEFGFVLLNQAGGLHLLDPLLIQLILASMVLSMLLTPLLIEKSDAIVLKLSANEWMMQSLTLTRIATRTMTTSKHVIIAGFGRSGQNLASMLEEEAIAYHALDLEPDRVSEAQASGATVSYGDAARRESLIAAGIHRAAALVITYTNTASALKVLHFAHELAPSLPVIVRSYDDSDLDKLRAAGATEVVPEQMEGSLMLSSQALVLLGVPLQRVAHRVQAAREQRYASLRGYFPGVGDVAEDVEGADHVRLHSVTLANGANAVGLAISELRLGPTGCEISMLRRAKDRIDITPDVVLQASDTLVLRGTTAAIVLAEARLR